MWVDLSPVIPFLRNIMWAKYTTYLILLWFYHFNNISWWVKIIIIMQFSPYFPVRILSSLLYFLRTGGQVSHPYETRKSIFFNISIRRCSKTLVPFLHKTRVLLTTKVRNVPLRRLTSTSGCHRPWQIAMVVPSIASVGSLLFPATERQLEFRSSCWVNCSSIYLIFI
jgi:hypothetical protein